MKQYEYLYCSVTTLTTGGINVWVTDQKGHHVKSIDVLGEEGWELVTVTNGTGEYNDTKIAILKRQKEK